MLWEAVFLLLILKIPIVYLCLVVWWAIRAEPRDEQPASVAVVTDTPSTPPPADPQSDPSRPSRRPGPRRHDRSRRERAAPRTAPAREAARR